MRFHQTESQNVVGATLDAKNTVCGSVEFANFFGDTAAKFRPGAKSDAEIRPRFGPFDFTAIEFQFAKICLTATKTHVFGLLGI